MLSLARPDSAMQLPFAFVSASEGTNVVKVFTEAIRIGKVGSIVFRWPSSHAIALDVSRKPREGLF